MLSVSIFKAKDLPSLWKLLPSVPRPRKYLAGGTDLVVRAKQEPQAGVSWIDVGALPELGVLRAARTSFFIGAGVKVAELEDHPEIKKWFPALHSACAQSACPSLKNMATLGGNCANASPAADGACALCAEGAWAVLERFGKKRRLPVEELFQGPGKTRLYPDELILGFEFRKTPRSGVYMRLVPRRRFAISKVSVAVTLTKKEKTVKSLRVFMGAVGPTILRAAGTEKYLRGRRLDLQSIREAKKIISDECRPITDHRSTAQYRRAMTGVLLARALEHFV